MTTGGDGSGGAGALERVVARLLAVTVNKAVDDPRWMVAADTALRMAVKTGDTEVERKLRALMGAIDAVNMKGRLRGHGKVEIETGGEGDRRRQLGWGGGDRSNLGGRNRKATTATTAARAKGKQE